MRPSRPANRRRAVTIRCWASCSSCTNALSSAVRECASRVFAIFGVTPAGDAAPASHQQVAAVRHRSARDAPTHGPLLPSLDMGVTIETRGLTKRYGATVAVDELSIKVQPGRVTAFVGPNGAGKTTTMHLLLGLAAADSGEALVDGDATRRSRGH